MMKDKDDRYDGIAGKGCTVTLSLLARSGWIAESGRGADDFGVSMGIGDLFDRLDLQPTLISHQINMASVAHDAQRMVLHARAPSNVAEDNQHDARLAGGGRGDIGGKYKECEKESNGCKCQHEDGGDHGWRGGDENREEKEKKKKKRRKRKREEKE